MIGTQIPGVTAASQVQHGQKRTLPPPSGQEATSRTAEQAKKIRSDAVPVQAPPAAAQGGRIRRLTDEEPDAARETLLKRTRVDEHLPVIKDKVMDEFREVTELFVGKTLESVFKISVEPLLGGMIAGIPKLSDGLRSLANFALNMDERAQSPLFEKFKNFTTETGLTPDQKKILTWLLKDALRSNFKEVLVQRVCDEIDKPDAATVDAFVEWVTKTDRTKTLKEYFVSKKLTVIKFEYDCKIMFETAVFLLAEHKIEGYIQRLDANLSGQLPHLVKKMVVENGRCISGIIVRRFVDLMTHFPQKQMFDGVVDQLAQQTEAVIKVESARSSARDTERDRKGLEAYRAEPFCHPRIAEIIDCPISAPKRKEKIAEQLFSNHAEQIIRAILPKYSVTLPTGTVEVDGLVYLLDHIVLPEEFKDMEKEALEISKEILSPDTQGIFHALAIRPWGEAYEAIERLIKRRAATEIKKAIITTFMTVFEKFTSTDFIYETLATTVLPSIQAALDGNSEQKEDSSSVSATPNPKFGDLAVNIAFYIGKLGGIYRYALPYFVIKEKVTNLASKATYEMSTSPHYLLKMATKAMRDSLPKIEEGSRAGQKEKIERPFLEIKLGGEIQKLSEIAYEFASKLSGTYATFVGSPSHIAEVTTRIFKAMFGNQTMQKNLLIRIQEVFLQSLGTACQAADIIAKETPKRVAKRPMIIPGLLPA